MLVHVDSLLRFVSLDEFFFSFFKPVLILQMKSVLQMNLWQLVFGVIVCKSKRLLKLVLVSFKINGCFNQSIL